MTTFKGTLRLTTYAAAIMLSGYSATLVSAPAFGQGQKESESLDPNNIGMSSAGEEVRKGRKAPEQDPLAKYGGSMARKEVRKGSESPKGEFVDVDDYIERWVPVAPPEDVLKAAKQGDANAQANLGYMYQEGRVVAQNYGEAIRWYGEAADQGETTSQNNLGAMYQAGLGVAQNYAAALRWYRKAAERGNATAQRNLGAMYYKGDGVLRDYTEAARWYRKAAEQGDSDSQFILGVRYEHGQGVPQDYEEAARWYWLAAEQGNGSAQGYLSRMYAYGYGVSKDYVQAHLWMNLAASRASGYDQSEYARERDLLTAKMSGRQVREAQRLAREWKPKSGLAFGAGPTSGSWWESDTLIWGCLPLALVGIVGAALLRWKRSSASTLQTSTIGKSQEPQRGIHYIRDQFARLWTGRQVPGGSSVKDMNPDNARTLFTQARTSFAEVREAFPGSAATVIEIDQEPPGEDRVRATFLDDPAQPSLRVERFPKPNLVPNLAEAGRAHQPLIREFDAFSDGSKFGWLERPSSESPHSSADIIEILRELV